MIKNKNCMLSKETHSKYKGSDRLKVKGCTKTFHASTNQNRVDVAVLVLSKAGYRTRTLSEIKRCIA